MIKQRLEVLNRHKRVLDAIRAGEDYKKIAKREGYVLATVYAIAVRNGIVKRRRKPAD